MNALRRFGAIACIAVVALSGQILAGNIALSGTVVKPDATPLPNVTVRLAQAGLTATTDAQGAWLLGSAAEIRGVRSVPIASTGNLRLDNGRLTVRLGERDIAGRGQGKSPKNASVHAMTLNRSQLSVPDTLVYTYNQKVFLRDTTSTFDKSGIVRVYDSTVNPKITYGYLKDARDGKLYRTVVIGSQTWMAEDLNYRTDSSYCYENDTVNCATFGRMYLWAQAMGFVDLCNSTICAQKVTAKIQGACPSGWHVPSDAEWNTLTDTILVAATSGKKLKASSSLWVTNTGTDEYGFHALSGGFFNGTYIYGGYSEIWWSATESNSNFAMAKSMGHNSDNAVHGSFGKYDGFHLRCMKGE